MKISVIYDNEVLEKGVVASHGFSALIESENLKLLFDTGWNGSLLLDNAKKLGLKINDVKAIFLSHQHWDHIGGLTSVLNVLDDKPILYVPASFSRSLKRELASLTRLVEVSSNPVAISGDLYATGELPSDIGVSEQSLYIKSSQMVVVGCSHPGVDTIVERAKQIGAVKTIIGGFHGFDKLEYFKQFTRIYPCHCTVAKSKILSIYPEKAKQCGVGLSILTD